MSDDGMVPVTGALTWATNVVARWMPWAARLAVVITLTTSCTAPPQTGALATTGTSRTATSAQPAASSVMICAGEAADDISAVLDMQPGQPPVHTWSDHLYTCRYRFSDATITLSVKELADPAAADAYYASRTATHPGWKPLPELGKDAFVAPDGYTVVRKDTSVLQVDVTGLPDRFGPRRLARAEIGIAIATIIMGCWS
jgi:hypothetical protein